MLWRTFQNYTLQNSSMRIRQSLQLIPQGMSIGIFLENVSFRFVLPNKGRMVKLIKLYQMLHC